MCRVWEDGGGKPPYFVWKVPLLWMISGIVRGSLLSSRSTIPPCRPFPWGLLSVPAFAYSTPCPGPHCLLVHTQTSCSLTGTLPPEPTQHLPPTDPTPGRVRPFQAQAHPVLCCPSRPGPATSPPGEGFPGSAEGRDTASPPPHPMFSHPCRPSPGQTEAFLWWLPPQASRLVLLSFPPLPARFLPLTPFLTAPHLYSIHQTAIIVLPPNFLFMAQTALHQ